MKRYITRVLGLCVVLSLVCQIQAQQVGTSSNGLTALPRLVRFSGTARDINGNPLTGVVGITFALYSDESGGAALWLESQNVQADANGRYTVLLGASKPDGLPTDMFTSEQARWVGIQISGQTEQPRVLLVSAPYALKAGDAETVGGLPASAFVLANPDQSKTDQSKLAQPKLAQPKAAALAASSPASQNPQGQSPAKNSAITGKGTIGYVPMFDTTTDIIDSLIFQKSSDIGIGTKTPAATLDVSGSGAIRDTLTLFPKGKDSTLAINGTAFNIDQTGNVTFISGQKFPGTGGGGTVTSVGSGAGLTGGPITKSGTLSIAAGGVTNAMLQNSALKLTPGGGMTGGGSVALGSSTTLGLENCSANQVLEFIGSAWTCASAGTGTITGISAGTDLTGGGTSGTVTLNLDTTRVPQLNSSNAFTGNQSINGNLTAASSSGIGLAGNSTSGFGVAGSSSSGVGVEGSSSSGAGIVGSSSSSDGVVGTSGTGYGVYAQSSNSGVVGTSSGTSKQGAGRGNAGVWGDTGAGANSGHAGVLGTADANTAGWFINNGPFATVLATNSSPEVGAFAVAASSGYVGVYGIGTNTSATGGEETFPAGMWGDTGLTDGIAVYGTADVGSGGLFVNNNSEENDGLITLEAVNLASNPQAHVFLVGGTGECDIDSGGDLFCTGSKSAVVPVDGGSRKVALYAIEGPENWFEDAGSGQLSNGSARVDLDPTFAQTVNTEMDYKVFPVPNGDCKGLYITNKTQTSFEVHELGGGASSVAFDYRIMAKRKGYENIRLADRTKQTIDVRTQVKKMRRPVKPSAAANVSPASPVTRLETATLPLADQPR